MTLANTIHVRGSVKSFTFKHRSGKLGNLELTTQAINEANAQKKAWDDVRKMYQEKKKAIAA